MGRAPVGVPVRRARARAVMAPVVGLAAEASVVVAARVVPVVVAAPVAPADVMVVVAGGETVTRALSARVSGSSPS